jgi:MFS transporter, DHA2 family, multidrug resistance protein
MSEAVIGTVISAPVVRRTINPWIVAIAVVVPTFMEVLDTTIANVALHQIAGGLSAAVTDSEWVITSYLAANAIILPISGWISARLGRRNYFLLAIAVFTLSSGLCGFATSLNQLILFRIMQGLAGGGLQPSSQGVLIDNFPPEKQGSAMTLFGVAALLAPIIGPTLGGWLTDNYSWRWIFYINIPVGIVAVLASWFLLEDPDYLKKQRAELKKNPTGFDTIGLSLLSITMVSWEVVLSKGQEWDWFNDPFFRVQTLASLFVLGLGGLIFWESRQRFPVVNFKPLLRPNFAPCCIIIFCAYGVLYGSSTTLPSMLQTLFGYDATHAGLVLSPSGVFAIMMMILIGILIGRGVDARLLIGAGLVTLSISNIWMSRMNLDISPWQVVWPRVVLIVGLSMIFAPLNVAAYIYMPRELRGAAVGLLALLRNEGGSVGTSIAQTFQERREQVHLLRLNEYLDPFNPAVANYLAQAKQAFLQATGDPVAAKQMALASLDAMRQQQASSLGYFDCFWLFSVLGGGLVFLVFLMKRSVAEKGAHVASE